MKLENCRICGNGELKRILNLGEMPLANAFIDKNQLSDTEKHYPLRVVWCDKCGLLQIDEVVSPVVLFKNYIYVSGTSDFLRKHFEGMATDIVGIFNLNNDSVVIDIASNDGTLLKEFKKLNVKVLGIEPAVNISKIAEQNGIKTINDFFSEAVSVELVKQTGKVDVITATNVVAHINDLDDLLKGVSHLLKEDGVFVMEVPYLVDLLDKTEFDTIYHEHLSYFAVRPLLKLFEKHDFKLIDVKRVNIHGGTIRVYASKNNSNNEVKKSANQLISMEITMGLDQEKTYLEFAERIENLKDNTINLLRDLKSQNKVIIGYGAAAKGNVLLNYYQIGTELIDFIVDMNPMKQGMFTPGLHIPVHPTDKILKVKPDYILILAWNFADEIMAQQQEFKAMGGKFIIPVPKVMVV